MSKPTLGQRLRAARLVASCPALEGRVPEFYARNEDALADIQRLAELEPAL